jgi:hypothetical protein
MSSAEINALESNEDSNSISEELTKNPQMTYFKSVFRKHTNFSFDWEVIGFEEGGSFGSKIKFILNKNKESFDMLQDCVLKIILPQIECIPNTGEINWIEKVGHAIIKKITLKIGEREICSHSGEYFEIYNQLNMQNEKLETYYNMIGSNVLLLNKTNKTIPYALYIPLIFWFNKDIGLSLPLCAINQNISVDVELQRLDKLIHKYNEDHKFQIVSGQQLKVDMLCKYYKLSNIERNRFATINHKYLIEQVQEIEHTILNVSSNADFSIPLTGLKFPVKEIIWTIQPDDYTNDINNFRLHTNKQPDYNTPFNYSHLSSFSGKNFASSFSFNIHGNSYFENIEPQVFNLYLPYKYHSRAPEEGIFVYPFSEKPNEYQPSGCINFSRISSNDSTLKVRFNNLVNEITGRKVVKVKIYAINYNIFNISNSVNGSSTSLSYFQ